MLADLVDLEAFVARESTPSSGGTSERRERESLLNRGAALVQCEAVLPGLLESLVGPLKFPFVFTYRTSNYIYKISAFQSSCVVELLAVPPHFWQRFINVA